MADKQQVKESDKAVRMRLLEAGKKEFLSCGYEKASLRKICAGAGVTTGALYFFFQNKHDLFEQIVKSTIDAFEKLTKKMIEEELEDSSIGADNEKILLEFLWKNQDVVRLLVEKAEGTKYECFVEEVTESLEAVFRIFFQKYSEGEPDKELIHILVKMKLQGYMELITGGYSLERTLELAGMLGEYTDGGFESLMAKLNNRM